MTKSAEPSLLASVVAPSPDAGKRPWYKVKRILGTAVGIIGGAMVATGGTIVVATVLSVPVTVASIGWVLAQAGVALFGFGWGQNNQKIADK